MRSFLGVCFKQKVGGEGAKGQVLIDQSSEGELYLKEKPLDFPSTTTIDKKDDQKRGEFARLAEQIILLTSPQARGGLDT